MMDTAPREMAKIDLFVVGCSVLLDCIAANHGVALGQPNAKHTEKSNDTQSTLSLPD